MPGTTLATEQLPQHNVAGESGGDSPTEGRGTGISGFTFLRNGSKLHYPILESIRSALPIVDEFVIALAEGDPDDDTRARVESLGSDKIRIVDTTWDLVKFAGGTVYAQQTDVAKSHCVHEWLLYLQGDEVLHEDDYAKIVEACRYWKDRPEVDALLFDYLHFWGDYEHVHDSHRWYKQEMRVIRNDDTIHSLRDAQSFRRIRSFDGVSYQKKEGTEKLTAVHSGARIFHYGWVRPPSSMQAKCAAFNWHHLRRHVAGETDDPGDKRAFDYGPLGRIPRFEGTHPKVMHDRVESLEWKDQLNQGKSRSGPPTGHPHERLKYRAITWLERTFFGGRHLFASRNYTMLKGLPLPRRRNGPTHASTPPK